MLRMEKNSIWIGVPDTSAPGFVEEYCRQIALLALPANRDTEVDRWLEENNRALLAEEH